MSVGVIKRGCGDTRHENKDRAEYDSQRRRDGQKSRGQEQLTVTHAYHELYRTTEKSKTNLTYFSHKIP